MRTVTAMSRLEVRSLTADDLAEAAALLAERHRRHRSARPLLSPRYEDAERAAAALPALDEASGAAAFRDGTMVAYVLGAPKSNAMWGPNIWVEAAGTAAREPEAVR